MTIAILISELFGGLILLFILGQSIGHLFKLDIYYEEIQKNKSKRIQKADKSDDQNFCNLKILSNPFSKIVESTLKIIDKNQK